jgi:hypothetical protein
MAGHIFIIRGDLRKLACDAWLMPCSRSAAPDGEWFLDEHTGPRKGEPFVEGESRSQRLPGNFNKQPQPWLTRIGAARKEIQWYVDGAIDFLQAVSDALAGEAPLCGRPNTYRRCHSWVPAKVVLPKEQAMSFRRYCLCWSAIASTRS